MSLLGIERGGKNHRFAYKGTTGRSNERRLLFVRGEHDETPNDRVS